MFKNFPYFLFPVYKQINAGLPRSVKSQEKRNIFKVREKSVNFAFGQEIWNSAQSRGKVREIYIILDIMSTKSQD